MSWMSRLLCSLSHGSSSLNCLNSAPCSMYGRIATRQLKPGLPDLSANPPGRWPYVSWQSCSALPIGFRFSTEGARAPAVSTLNTGLEGANGSRPELEPDSAPKPEEESASVLASFLHAGRHTSPMDTLRRTTASVRKVLSDMTQAPVR